MGRCTPERASGAPLARIPLKVGRWLLPLPLLCWGGCASDDVAAGPAPDAATGGTVHVLFEPGSSGPIEFGDVPFPDALYLTEAGEVALRMPWSSQADPALTDHMIESLASIDGFGIMGPIFFGLDGAIDPATLPADADASLHSGASVFVIEFDTNSPDTFKRVPVRVEFDPESDRIVVIPDGASFLPRRQYAAVVTRDVRAGGGQPLEPSPAFLRVRDRTPLNGEPRLQRARTTYEPVFDELSRQGMERDAIVGLAAFRAQSVKEEMSEASILVTAQSETTAELSSRLSGEALDAVLGEPEGGEQGLNIAGGVAHGNIGEMIHGSFRARHLLSNVAFAHGAFTRDETTDALVVQRRENVPFTLWLPRGRTTDTALGVVVFAHGLRGERSDALALADQLAAANLAVVALDAPFSGQRDRDGDDRENRFTGEMEPDGFGDSPGSFMNTEDTEGELAPYHPFYYRDAVRQGALDILAFLAVARRDRLAALTEQPLDLERVAVVGVDVGATMALMVATLDTRVELVGAAFVGGYEVANWTESPAYRTYLAALSERLGLPQALEHPLWQPELSLVQLLLDRAEAVAWARLLASQRVNLLQLESPWDELVSGRASSRMAVAFGATVSEGDQQPGDVIADRPTEDGYTRHLVRLPEGTHAALCSQVGVRNYSWPYEPPFEPLDEPQVVDNPRALAAGHVLSFVTSWRTCVASSAPLCPGELATSAQ